MLVVSVCTPVVHACMCSVCVGSVVDGWEWAVLLFPDLSSWGWGLFSVSTAIVRPGPWVSTDSGSGTYTVPYTESGESLPGLFLGHISLLRVQSRGLCAGRAAYLAPRNTVDCCLFLCDPWATVMEAGTQAFLGPSVQSLTVIIVMSKSS